MTNMRLNKFIAACGLSSRRGADQLIAQGAVTINGSTVTEAGSQVDPQNDQVIVNDQLCKLPTSQRYLLLFKPRGYICSNADPFAKNLAIDLFPAELGRIYSVGRLDKDSEGLIIFTDDGDFAQQLGHPSYGQTKTYRVSVEGPHPSDETLAKLCAEGVTDQGERLKPETVKILNTDASRFVLEIVLIEGKNREIRRMCEAMGWTVKRLARTAVGQITDKSLKPGEWRDLTPAEIASLRP